MASHANSTPAPTSRRVTTRHAESEVDAFRRWEAEAHACEVAAQAMDEDDAEFSGLWAKQADLETLILVTPAATRPAMLVKARLGRLDRHRDVDGAGVALFEQIIEYLAEGDDREKQTRFAGERGS
ncbi:MULTISPECIES: hypothetical protein [unclassified Brevundimonas]|uniref:hypothetical protein n=1 Tax=unclassified Brevundimonas TaxID=2622653 RepID=UPI000B2223D4|nr:MULTISPECIES: hypothetical protein [unclassified Brevundimonas]